MEDILDQGTKSSNISNGPKIPLPNSGGILAMGIISIVFAGSVGFILGIISLALSGPALRLYNEHPDKYTESSYKNAKAGKVCAIIGVSLAGLVLLFLAIALAANL